MIGNVNFPAIRDVLGRGFLFDAELIGSLSCLEGVSDDPHFLVNHYPSTMLDLSTLEGFNEVELFSTLSGIFLFDLLPTMRDLGRYNVRRWSSSHVPMLFSFSGSLTMSLQTQQSVDVNDSTNGHLYGCSLSQDEKMVEEGLAYGGDTGGDEDRQWRPLSRVAFICSQTVGPVEMDFLYWHECLLSVT
ncbi:hypothetical protein ACFE04_014662 [Oxalis oulophora]